MQVILTKDVDTLGAAGEQYNVSEGYALNYLFPRSLAIVASKGALKDLDARKHQLEQKAAKKLKEDQERAARIQEIGTLTLAARAGEDGKLYGSVTTKQLADLMTQKLEFEVDRKNLKLNHPINRLGDYQLTIVLSPKVKTEILVTVVADEESDTQATYGLDSVDE